MGIKTLVLFGGILAILASGIVNGAQASTSQSKSIVLSRTDENLDAAVHNKAVVLARKGQYEAALELLKRLVEAPDSRPEFFFDYATVTGWAGQYDTTVSIYETRILPLKVAIPDYVKVSVAGAYYRLGRFQQAGELYHQLAAAGNRRAKLWEAESLTQLADIQGAMRLYEEIAPLFTDDSEFYVGRALLSIKSNDPVSAMLDAKIALKLAADQDYKRRQGDKIAEIRAAIARAFIGNGDYPQAIVLLRPVIEEKTATLKMECDYILALFLNGDYANAIAAGDRLWLQPAQVPVYGRRALADTYLRAGYPGKAITLYQSMISEEAALVNDRQNLAYAYVKDGQTRAGLTLYRKLINLGPKRADCITSDAVALLKYGDYHNGKQLFELITERYPEQYVFRQKFAWSLAEAGLFRDAYQQYQWLFEDTDGDDRLAAAAGMAVMATAVGDYKAARSKVELLGKESPALPTTARVAETFRKRSLGEVRSDYVATDDYKGNEVRLFQISGEQRLNDSLAFLAVAADKRVADDSGSKWQKTYSAGLRYLDLKQTITAQLDINDAEYNGYSWQYQYFFNERYSVELLRQRAPMDDFQALTEGIMRTANRMAWNWQMSGKDSFILGIGLDSYSDGNQSYSLDFKWDHTVVTDSHHEFGWFLYGRESQFERQIINSVPTVYESPERREAVGGGLHYRLQMAKSYLEGTAALEWGRDRPEPVDYSSEIGLEYGYSLTPLQTVIFATEYGSRTGRSTNSGSGLYYGCFNYNLSYRMSW